MKKSKRNKLLNSSVDKKVLTVKTKNGGGKEIDVLQEKNITNGDNPLFIVKSGINGGSSLEIIPNRFFVCGRGSTTKTVLTGKLIKGSLKVNDIIRIVDLYNNHGIIMYVAGIERDGVSVDFASVGDLIGISLRHKSGERVKYKVIIDFNDLVYANKQTTSF